MTIAISAILMTALFFIEIVRPVAHFNRWRSREAYERELRLYQLRVVREFYPVLENLTLDEIDQKFGLTRVYHSVGRAYLARSRNF